MDIDNYNKMVNLHKSKEELKAKIIELKKNLRYEKQTLIGCTIAGISAIVIGNIAGVLQYGMDIIPVAISIGLSSLVLIPVVIHEKRVIKKGNKELEKHESEINNIDNMIESLNLTLDNNLEDKPVISYIDSNDYTLDNDKPLVLKRDKYLKH